MKLDLKNIVIEEPLSGSFLNLAEGRSLEDFFLKQAREAIEQAVKRWHYQPIPKKFREEFYQHYNNAMNGFQKPEKRDLTIAGKTIAFDYSRVVVGDYGAYVEIAQEDMFATLKLKEGQEWRTDEQYLNWRQISKSVKYVWYVYNAADGKEIKVYLQRNPVKYADYKPGYYYISVLDFDKE